jgi:hypothetical protein
MWLFPVTPYQLTRQAAVRLSQFVKLCKATEAAASRRKQCVAPRQPSNTAGNLCTAARSTTVLHRATAWHAAVPMRNRGNPQSKPCDCCESVACAAPTPADAMQFTAAPKPEPQPDTTLNPTTRPGEPTQPTTLTNTSQLLSIATRPCTAIGGTNPSTAAVTPPAKHGTSAGLTTPRGTTASTRGCCSHHLHHHAALLLQAKDARSMLLHTQQLLCILL